MTWRIAPVAAIGLIIIAGINLWLLAVLASGLASYGPSSLDKVDWSFSSSSAMRAEAMDTYSQALARPIFFKSREPFVPAPPQPPKVAAPAPAPVDPGLVLGGVMIKDDVRKAYVESIGRRDGTWIRERESFMGWRIQSISTTGARLQQGNRSIELQLYPRQ